MAVLEGLAEQLKRVAERVGVRAVFGEPIQAHGRTWIPVAKVTYGFGFGGGQRHRHEQEEDQEQEQQHDQAGGGGVALVARPVAMLEIRDDGTRWLLVWDANRLVLASLAVVAWIVFWITRRPRPSG